MSVADLLGGPAPAVSKGPRCTFASWTADDRESVAQAIARGWTPTQIAERFKASDIHISNATIGRHFVRQVCGCWR